MYYPPEVDADAALDCAESMAPAEFAATIRAIHDAEEAHNAIFLDSFAPIDEAILKADLEKIPGYEAYQEWLERTFGILMSARSDGCSTPIMRIPQMKQEDNMEPPHAWVAAPVPEPMPV